MVDHRAERVELRAALAIAQFSSELVVPFNLVLAMSVLSVLPVIVMFLFLQRHIVTRIAQTGMK